jgi:septal ring factor EnvC (AmiA/AmiB activator)
MWNEDRMTDYCKADLMLAAADAIEAADEKIADYTAAIEALDDSNDAYIKENERLKKRIEDLETALAACRARREQMPKRGEWMRADLPDAMTNKCSLCGYEVWDEYRYCPNCGAEMRGEHDAES